MSAEKFNFPSLAAHWMALTPDLFTELPFPVEFLTKAFIHWMPCPHSVKRRFFKCCFPHLPVVNKFLRFWPSDWNRSKLIKIDWNWLKLIEKERKSIEMDWKLTRIWRKTIEIAENWLRRFRKEGGVKKHLSFSSLISALSHPRSKKGGYWEERSMDQCQFKEKLLTNFQRHWSIQISLKTRQRKGLIGPYEFPWNSYGRMAPKSLWESSGLYRYRSMKCSSLGLWRKSQSPKAGHPKAGRSDFRNQRFKPDTGKMRKMRTSLPPQENKGLRKLRRTKALKTRKMRKMRTQKRGKCGWLALMWLALGDPQKNEEKQKKLWNETKVMTPRKQSKALYMILDGPCLARGDNTLAKKRETTRNLKRGSAIVCWIAGYAGNMTERMV